MQLQVNDRGRPRTDRAFLRRVVAVALDQVGRPDLSVSLLLTGDAESARLHRQFFADATPTDVMSFPLDGAVEIAVNVARARREAERRGHSIRAEVALYVVHGILHACGYDDRRRGARARMRAAERAILSALRLRIAPVDD